MVLPALASKAPTPGGGGASAYAGALASALASMVGNLTVGKEKYADVQDRVQAELLELEGTRIRLLELIDADAAPKRRLPPRLRPCRRRSWMPARCPFRLCASACW